jgi:hypothetical protein
MTDDPTKKAAVDQFIIEQIDSVPHLEALLLIWTRRPQQWSVDQIACSLYIRRNVAEEILKDLSTRGLISTTGKDVYFCDPQNPELDELLSLVATTYSRELIRVSTLIHSKAPASVREFARAFRFTKERE